jgi:hypothetical protein
MPTTGIPTWPVIGKLLADLEIMGLSKEKENVIDEN